MEKSYICHRFPFLKIGDSVEFQGGKFTTGDPTVQAYVESNEWFKVHIHPMEHYDKEATSEEPEVAVAPEEPSPSGGVVSGLRGTRKGR